MESFYDAIICLKTGRAIVKNLWCSDRPWVLTVDQTTGKQTQLQDPLWGMAIVEAPQKIHIKDTGTFERIFSILQPFKLKSRS